jgi:uncharacterized protein (DUF433 family)
MKQSYRMAFAGLAALLCSSTAPLAQGSVIPLGTVVSALSQSEIKTILREIRSGTPVATVLARYDITPEELSQLQQLATRLGIEDVQDLRQEVRLITRDLRSGVPLSTVLQRYGLTAAELEQLADRFGFEDLVDRIVARTEKAAGKAEKRTTKRERTDDDDETTSSTGGASRFAPGQMKSAGKSAREYAPGQQKAPSESARTYAPGQQNRTADPDDDDTTTGSVSTGSGKGPSATGERGLDRAGEVANSNSQDGRENAREAMGGNSGNPGGEQGGGKGSDNGKGNDGDKSK